MSCFVACLVFGLVLGFLCGFVVLVFFFTKGAGSEEANGYFNYPWGYGSRNIPTLAKPRRQVRLKKPKFLLCLLLFL